jgi:arsenate reductase
LDPEVVDAMRELGIDLSGRVPRGITQEDVEWADVVVTMGCGDDACPVLPGKRYVDWEIRDPIGLPIADVRVIRDDIRRRIAELLEAS